MTGSPRRVMAAETWDTSTRHAQNARQGERESIETPTSQTWADIIVNGQRPQKHTHTDTREDQNPRVNQRAYSVIPPPPLPRPLPHMAAKRPVNLLPGLKLQTNRALFPWLSIRRDGTRPHPRMG